LKWFPEKKVGAMEPFGGSTSPFVVEADDAAWDDLLAAGRAWLKRVGKDWIRANKDVQSGYYPLDRRYGIVPHALVRASLKDWFRVDEEIGRRRCRKFIRLVEDEYFLRDCNNTTHINLAVYRPLQGEKQGYRIELCGASFTRLAETVKMFLALTDASKPIAIADPEGIRNRLLAQDNIGIVPGHNMLHRANQHFSAHQQVYDVLHYRTLGRYKRRLDPFIVWEPLPVLKPEGWFQ